VAAIARGIEEQDNLQANQARTASRPIEVDTPERPLRSDAELDRRRIIEAANEIFAEEGVEVPVERIAARAGVGIGTLYRRFSTKVDLLKEIAAAAMDKISAMATQVMIEVAAEDAMCEFIRRCVAAPSAWRAAVAETCSRSRDPHLEGAVQTLLDRGQLSGTVRADAKEEDVFLVLISIRLIAHACGSDRLGVSGRLLDLLVDGLRVGPSSETPG
jgi:AcrR family transcriptional regulator